MKRIILFLVLIIMFIPIIAMAETCDLDKISISSITMENKSNTVTELDEATANGQNINLKLDMVKLEDNINYRIVIKNDSNSDYEVDKNSFNSNSEYIVYSIKSEDNKNIVKAKSSKSFILNVQYKNKIPEEKFNNGEYNYDKDIKIVLFSGIKNPNTLSNIAYVLLIIIVLGLVTFTNIRKKRLSKSMILVLSLLVIPIGVNAVCKYEINVNSKIIIEGKDPKEVENGPYYNINKDKKYPTLATAVDRARSNQTIKVLEDTEENTIVNIPDSLKGLKIDLNSKNINFEYTENESYIIANNGELELYNSNEEEGRIQMYGYLQNNGTLIINENANLASEATPLDNKGTVYIQGGKISSQDGGGIYNYGTTILSDGSIGGYANGITNYSKVLISGGIVSSAVCGVLNDNSDSILTLSGDGDISSSRIGVINKGVLDTNGGKINGKDIGVRNFGQADINNTDISIHPLTYSSGVSGIYNEENGELKYNNGIISAYSVDSNNACYGIYNKGKADITEATINVNASSSFLFQGAGIVTEGITALKSGTVNCPYHGLEVKNNGTLTLGNADNQVNTTTPLIKTINDSANMESRGVVIEDGGIFNYYDGLIKSANGRNPCTAIEGTVTSTPRSYSVHTEITDGVENAYLVAD